MQPLQVVLLVVIFAAASLLSLWMGQRQQKAPSPAELQAQLAELAAENQELKRQLSERATAAACSAQQA